MSGRDTPAIGRVPQTGNASPRRPWHTLEPDALALEVGSSAQGLSREEARLRLERDGPNELAEAPPTSPPSMPDRSIRRPRCCGCARSWLRHPKRTR